MIRRRGVTGDIVSKCGFGENRVIIYVGHLSEVLAVEFASLLSQLPWPSHVLFIGLACT